MWDPTTTPANAPPLSTAVSPRSSMFNLDPPQMIRVLFIDYAGRRRTKMVPAFRIQDNVRFARCVIAMISTGALAENSDLGPSNELLAIALSDLRPDAKPPAPEPYCNVAFRPIPLPWHPNHAIQLCNLTEDSGEPSPLCPRAALRRAVDVLAELGLNAKAGFELEFILYHRGPGPDGPALMDRPVGSGIDDNFAGMEMIDDASDFLDDAVACMEQMHVPVRLVHAEAAPGQFEIVLDHCDVLESVDRLIVAREVVRAVARRHKLVATFSPKIGKQVGSGAHSHYSLDGHFGTDDVWRGEHFGVDAVGRAFMAGMLDGLPWTFPFVNGHPLAYRRVVPGYWAGAFKMWGINNKEAAVRLMDDRSNFEVKCGDGITNPYMQVAALLTAGALGVRGKMELPEPCAVDPQMLQGGKCQELLPNTLERALAAFDKVRHNEMICRVFPKELLHNFLCVKRADGRHGDGMTLEEYERLTVELH